MKILFTSGTTKLLEPILWLEDLVRNNYIDAIDVQSLCDYNSKFFKIVKFIPQLDYSKYNLIISHAGAGTVYQVLEKNIPLIIIPDLWRNDKHQKDMAYFVKKNELALVAYNYSELLSALNQIISKETVLKPYHNESPFDIQKLINLINE